MTASTFMNCIFSNNSCEAKGGALYADMGSMVNEKDSSTVTINTSVSGDGNIDDLTPDLNPDLSLTVLTGKK